MSLISERPRRVGIVDELRGLFILLMVFYHGMYDLVEIFGLDLPFFYSLPMRFLQTLIAGNFVILSGMVCHYSHNNLKRGAYAFGFGMILTVVTTVVMPSQIVMFGILHLLGSCMMLFALLKPLLIKIPTILGAPFFILLFILTLYVPRGMLGYPPFAVALPQSLYTAGYLFPFGFPSPAFFSSDYFPLIPWLFLFLAGSYLGIYGRRGELPEFCYRKHIPWLAKVGSYTIWIYLLHQPVLYGVFSIIFKLSQFRL